MPRLTNARYLELHAQLRRIWTTDAAVFAFVSARQQRQLHDYFRPAVDLDSDQLLEHRRVVSAQQPQLPQQAGRAWRALATALHLATLVMQAAHTTTRVKGRRQPRGQVTVRPVVKPQPDAKHLAQLLVTEILSDIVKEQSGEQSSRSAPGS